MQNKFFIGDKILTKGKIDVISFYFTGCENLDNNQWKVSFALIASQGYSGQGSSMTITVKEGESIRFGKGYKLLELEPRIIKEKKVLREVHKIKFDEIEKDCITIS